MAAVRRGITLKGRDLSTSRSRTKAKIGLAGRVLLAGIALLTAHLAGAADNALLIQLQPGGRYTLWHTEGMTRLSDDEVLSLAATARPEGGEPMVVSAGTARAFDTGQGVMISIPEAASDKKLLVDRDDCGAIKLWHAEGSTQLTEEQMTELVISALPGGGRPIDVGGRYAKAFISPLGYTVVVWKPVKR